MDDIAIPAQDETKGLSKIEIVLEHVSWNELCIKWTKCQFLKRQINFLEYIVEDGKVLPSNGKTIAIEKFPIPANKK